MTRLVWLAGAGAAGTLARYGLMRAVAFLFPGPLPWATWTVNILGCFLFGVVLEAGRGAVLTSEARLIALAGFMGSFTTFSTYVADCLPLLEKGRYLALACNVAGQNLLGLAMLLAGMACVRALA